MNSGGLNQECFASKNLALTKYSQGRNLKNDLTGSSSCLSIDLNTAIARFSGNEALYLRFFRKMPMDTTYFSLVEAVEKKDYSLIEWEAHTLKRVAANLGLDSLRYASDGLVQAVRRKEYDEIPALFEIIKTAHEKVVEVLSRLD